MPARLVITDGTVEINLLDRSFGFHLSSWEPAIARYKQGGTFSDSPLADGRRLVDSHFENVFETFELKANSLSQDSLIRDTQELRRLLEKGASYWTANWQNEPVWIEARASQETNLRYSLVVAGSIANDDDPFQMPFLQPDCTAVMDELDLVVEREPFWRADEPGEGPCVEITGSQEYTGGPPWHLEFNATTSEVDCGSDNAIDDLPAADFMVDGWVRADSTGENASGYIIAKIQGGVGGWVLRTTVGGLVADVDYANISASAQSGLDEFAQDGLWHHVVLACDFAARTLYLAIDGGWVTSYLAQDVGDGAYVGDADDNLYIGNNAAGTRTWDGGIGWIRISNAFTWAVGVDFTPPDRCILPADVPGVTIAQWIGIESTGATIDNQEGTAVLDGTQTDCTFDGCSPEYGRAVETCLDEVYIANKHNRANITHIFQWSANWGFSANLQGGALPYDLIEIAGAAPAIGDYVVFGIDATLADSGPFMSLVFDIGTAISGITLTTWEYSDGVPGWGALPNMQDNTNADGQMTGNIFDTTGVKSLHFDPAADFLPQVENGVNGYWVRAIITAVPGPHVAPTQQLRDVYSIVWPYVEVASTEVLGDVTALLRTQAYNQCDHDGGATNLDASTSRFLISTRSVSRGSNFTSYLNLLAEQNPVGVTVTVLGVGAPVVNPDGPTGFHLSVPNPGAAWADVVRVAIDYPLSIEYNGRFRMLLRGDQITGAAGDIQFRVNSLFAGAAIYNTSDAVSFTNVTNTFQVLDFGAITVPAQVGSIPSTSVQFEVQVFGDGVADARLYDLILMPVDEYAIDTSELFYTDASRVYARGEPTERSYLDIDPITDPKQFATFVKQYANDRYTATWMNTTPQKPVLQSNSRQRIWFLCWQYPAPDDDPQDALPWIAHSIQMHKVQRYLSMRGSR